MEPHRPKGQASLYDLGCTKRKRTEDDVPARELIIRLRPDVQQAVAARDAAIAASIQLQEDEGEEEGGEAMQEELLRLKLGALKLVSDFIVNQH